MFRKPMPHAVAFVAALVLAAAPAPAQDSDVTNVLDDMLAAAQADIDALEAIIPEVTARPEEVIALDTDAGFVLVERATINTAVDLAASFLHELVQSSPTAAEEIGARLGDSVGDAIMEIAGVGEGAGADLGVLVGEVVAEVARAAAPDALTETQIRSRLAQAVEARLDQAWVPLSELRAELAARRQIYEAIDTIIDEVNAAADAPPVPEGDAGIAAAEADELSPPGFDIVARERSTSCRVNYSDRGLDDAYYIGVRPVDASCPDGWIRRGRGTDEESGDSFRWCAYCGAGFSSSMHRYGCCQPEN